jgi:hypothetical protein
MSAQSQQTHSSQASQYHTQGNAFPPHPELNNNWTKLSYKRGRSTEDETEREAEHCLNQSSPSNRYTAGWNATPEYTDTLKAHDCPILTEQQIEEKRRLLRNWLRLRTPEAKYNVRASTLKNEQKLANEIQNKPIYIIVII